MGILACTWWYWVIIGWRCLVLGGTGSVKGFYACIYLKNEEIWSGVTNVNSLTDRKQNIGLLSLSKV